eukprot:GHVU01129697.1.p1 GENE.GHVU01129697.1~~GHVU01129697.1.p1  ORF type:complete len:112 (-),score=8.36 GHVU01129697.1:85-420(-)
MSHLSRCDVDYCPKWHREGDERIIAHDYTLPYTRGVAIAPHPNVVIEDRDVVSVAGSNGPQKIKRLVHPSSQPATRCHHHPPLQQQQRRLSGRRAVDGRAPRTPLDRGEGN